MSTAHTLDRPRRWDAPFSDDISDEDILRLLESAPFNAMNAENFPRSSPLPDVLRNDARIRRYKQGEIIVREGDYGTSAFLILQGSARVVLSPDLPPAAVGRREPTRRGIFRALAQLWSNASEDEHARRKDRRSFLKQDVSHIILQDVPRVLDKHRTAVMQTGDFFGEIAALSRMPRTATIFAAEHDTDLLEVRWQGLRDLMRYDPALRTHIDKIYRERALSTYLAEIPFLKHLDEAGKARVMAATQFETYGDYDWSGDYKKLAQSGATAGKEPVIAAEGDYPNGIVMVRAGFARLTQRYGNGHRTLNYLGSGRIYGWDEIAHNWSNPEAQVALQHTLRVIGYTHVLVIPAAIIEQVVLPSLPKNLLPGKIKIEDSETASPFSRSPFGTATASPFGGTNSPFAGTASPFAKTSPKKPKGKMASPDQIESTEAKVGSELMEFITANRLFNGTETMVIDMDRCTRCDDCVRACAATHDNNPRFLRHGPVHDTLMVAQACMHCADPVCMIGCPTGAIHRDSFEGQVVINPSTCIGCTACANNCPYGSIRMTEQRDEDGNILVASDAKPIVKATKCDLCIDQYGGPACERACPHDALKRMDLTTLDELAVWLHR